MKVSVTCLTLQTYFVSAAAFTAGTVSRGQRCARASCTPARHHYGCCGSDFRHGSAVMGLTSSAARRHQEPVGRSCSNASTFLQQGSMFRPARATSATGHRSGRGSLCRLQGSTGDSVGAPTAFTPRGVSLVSGKAGAGAAEPLADEADASGGGGGGTSAAVAAMKWSLEQLQRVQRQLLELPEDTAEEGRFLMMAALVGVITGTAGLCLGSEVRRHMADVHTHIRVTSDLCRHIRDCKSTYNHAFLPTSWTIDGAVATDGAVSNAAVDIQTAARVHRPSPVCLPALFGLTGALRAYTCKGGIRRPCSLCAHASQQCSVEFCFWGYRADKIGNASATPAFRSTSVKTRRLGRKCSSPVVAVFGFFVCG